MQNTTFTTKEMDPLIRIVSHREALPKPRAVRDLPERRLGVAAHGADGVRTDGEEGLPRLTTGAHLFKVMTRAGRSR